MGRITISIVDFQDRERDVFETLAEMQATIGQGHRGRRRLGREAEEGPPQGMPVSIEIVGEDPAVLEALSDRAIGILESSPVYPKLVGLAERPGRCAARALGAGGPGEGGALRPHHRQVGNAIRAAINGVEAAKYRTGNDEYDIVVRLAEPYRNELEGLRELTVMNEGVQMPLVSVATWSVERGRRHDPAQGPGPDGHDHVRGRAGYQNNAVLAEVQQTLADFQEGAAARLHHALHRAVAGAGRGHRVPERRVHHRAHAHRLHPHQPVQLGGEAGDHHDLRHHVDHGRADRPDASSACPSASS
jgi:multidrug efflux pump